ncbi:MAG: CehA/McbA family metallohydrolase [Myxococcota bacterium]|nr:CehA/McbA family metallohydrolase [Myxococcota bacterium]
MVQSKRPPAVARAALLLALAALACGSDEPSEEPLEAAETADLRAGLSPDAQVGTADSLIEDLLLERHPGDGGGEGRLLELRAVGPDGVGEPVDSVRAGSRARVRMLYRAGPHGIAEGGVLFLQTSPFWDWQPAQTQVPQYDGYTAASTDAEGVELTAETYGQGLVGFTVAGRALEAGETVELTYGAGATGAIVDRYAERESPVWLHVDADGDGVRGVVALSPRIATHAGPAAILVLRQPTTAQPGEEIELRVSVLDALGNAGVTVEGEVRLEAEAGLEFPSRVGLSAGDAGTASVLGRALTAGVHRIRAQLSIDDPSARGGSRELVTVSDPIVVREGVPRILWADLHGHSNLSDGTGTPEDFFRYAREIGGLDVAALTDHDHWGMRFLDANPEMWERIQRAAAAAHEPGRFVTLLGYEWTSWLHGHRHVLYFDDTGPVLSSIGIERRYETPAQLWDALRGRRALTFAHHSAGGPVATNWAYAPDPELEPVTEIVSVHGSSEAEDSPRPIYSPVPGNYVRDALGLGYRLGLIGSGDSHDGHPGLTHLASPTRNSGLAAIFAAKPSREAVLAALRERRVYATNGPRIFLRTTLDDRYEMGSVVPAMPSDAVHTLEIRVASAAPLDRVDVIRGGEIALRLAGEGLTEWSAALELAPLEPGEFLYVRAVQQNDGAAWSSPFFGPAPGE